MQNGISANMHTSVCLQTAADRHSILHLKKIIIPAIIGQFTFFPILYDKICSYSIANDWVLHHVFFTWAIHHCQSRAAMHTKRHWIPIFQRDAIIFRSADTLSCSFGMLLDAIIPTILVIIYYSPLTLFELSARGTYFCGFVYVGLLLWQ